MTEMGLHFVYLLDCGCGHCCRPHLLHLFVMALQVVVRHGRSLTGVCVEVLCARFALTSLRPLCRS